MRIGLLYEALLRDGHKVRWFTSTFEHGEKRFLFRNQTELSSPKGDGKIILLHSPIAYNKNVALSRLKYHSNLSKAFRNQADRMEKPDLIFCSWPPMHFADAAVKFGNRMGVPTIIDARDLWPDIFLRALPRALQGMGTIGLMPYERMARRAFGHATAMTAIIPGHLEWALKKAGKAKAGPLDRCFYLCHERTELSATEREQALSNWEALGVAKDTWNLCFFGTISARSFDFQTVIEGFKLAVQAHANLRLVIVGDGDDLSHIKESAKDFAQIVFPGWGNAVQIQSLMEISKIGLYPLRNLPDFIDSFTNKLIGYLAEGLPALTSLTGFPKAYIEEFGCGFGYREGDPGDFAQKLLQLMDNESLRQEMGARGRERFLEDFDAQVVNNKLIGYFQEVIKQQRSAKA